MGIDRNTSSPANIELHIEELVLDGFAARDRYLIAEAIERELTRLFAEQSLTLAATDPIAMARLDGGSINVRPGTGAETIGAQLAQAIHGGLVR